MPSPPCLSCGTTTGVRLYPGGYRCPRHTPHAAAGLPEPDVARYCAPLRCYCRQCPSWTPAPAYTDDLGWAAVDARAIASGKRRATPQAVKAARAEVAAQKKRRRT